LQQFRVISNQALSGANLVGAQLSGATLRRAMLVRALVGILPIRNQMGALTGRSGQTSLIGADLTEALLDGVDLDSCRVS
jgi:uncharacterized protein YjbI with pentapeptide repeats